VDDLTSLDTNAVWISFIHSETQPSRDLASSRWRFAGGAGKSVLNPNSGGDCLELHYAPNGIGIRMHIVRTVGHNPRGPAGCRRFARRIRANACQRWR